MALTCHSCQSIKLTGSSSSSCESLAHLIDLYSILLNSKQKVATNCDFSTSVLECDLVVEPGLHERGDKVFPATELALSVVDRPQHLLVGVDRFLKEELTGFKLVYNDDVIRSAKVLKNTGGNSRIKCHFHAGPDAQKSREAVAGTGTGAEIGFKDEQKCKQKESRCISCVNITENDVIPVALPVYSKSRDKIPQKILLLLLLLLFSIMKAKNNH